METKKTFYTTCDRCGCDIYEEDTYYNLHNGDVYCDDCGCDLEYYDGEYYLAEEGVYLYNGDWVPQSELDWGNYYFCESCNEYYPYDEGSYHGNYWYCENCRPYSDVDDLICEWHQYNGDYELQKEDGETSNTRAYGLEIESETIYGELNRQMLENIQETIPCHFETDGSLDEGGFETITEPMTLNYILNNYDNFVRLFEIYEENNYDNNGSCGLHIHVTRPQKNDKVILSRAWLILETYKNEVIAFARRHNTTYASFLSDTGKVQDATKSKRMKKAMLSTNFISEYEPQYLCYHGDRYRAINNQNYKTIEFRIFDRPSDVDELYACIEFVASIMNVASDLSIDLTTMSFDDIMNVDERFTHLRDYCLANNISNKEKIKDNNLLYKAIKKADSIKKDVLRNDIKKLTTMYKASLIRNTNINVSLANSDISYYIALLRNLNETIENIDTLLYRLDNNSYDLLDYKYKIQDILRYNNTPKYYIRRFNCLLNRIEVMS